MLKRLAKLELTIIWVSDPICKASNYNADMAYLNMIYRQAVADVGATFLDITGVITDADGAYTAYGPTLDGPVARLRLDDGIHFTASGYDILAARILPTVTTSIVAANKAASP